MTRVLIRQVATKFFCSRIALIALMMMLSMGLRAQELKDTLVASRITDNVSRHVSKSQTGFERIDALSFNMAPVLGTPDVLRTLQMRAGVAMGSEMSSGLYVRGGDGSDNLFLFDGVPVYQLGHMGGMFSVVNSDVVESLDFYKSGFPARFGGKLSSVEDIRVKEGSFDRMRGSFSVGMTEGRVTLEGPFKNGKTSYLVSARQNWMSLFTKPMFAAAGRLFYSPLDNFLSDGNYGFSEVNGKIVHKHSESSTFEFTTLATYDYLNYSDMYTVGALTNGASGQLGHHGQLFGLKTNWSNLLATAAWKYTPRKRMLLENRVYFTRGSSRIGGDVAQGSLLSGKRVFNIERGDVLYVGTSVNEIGFKPNLWVDVSKGLSAVVGLEVKYDYNAPQRWSGSYDSIDRNVDNGLAFDKTMEEELAGAITAKNKYSSFEPAAYAELEWNRFSWINANFGLRSGLFITKGKTYKFFEPRLSASLHPFRALSLKASYAKMYQPMHRLSSSFYDLPGNCWLPSTSIIKPSFSDQYAASIELNTQNGWHAGVEVYYKLMHQLHEYGGELQLYPPVDEWELRYKEGEGRSKGLEFSFSHEGKILSLSAAYTLSYSDRHFPDFCDAWFWDRFDNRHKFNFGMIYQVKNGEVFAEWYYHTGNRATVPDYYCQQIVPAGPDIYSLIFPFASANIPNNHQFPAYHRLDVGYTQKFINKKGFYSEVSVGLYNAYNRKNPLMIRIDKNLPTLQPKVIYVSAFQIMPTLRWSCMF